MTNNLPPGWTCAKLGDLVAVLDRMRVPLNKAERSKRLGSVPYYGATGQVGWIDEALFDEELLLLGEDGAPFLDPSKRKSYIIRGPSWVNNHAHVLRALDGLTTNHYLRYYLDFVDYRPHVTGTTRLKLTQRAMRSILIKIPSVSEQERIVAAIEEHFTRLDAVEATLAQTVERLDAFRSSVFADVFHIGNDLPPDWGWATIDEIAEVQLGRQRSPEHHFGERVRPYLRSANVTWSGISLHDVKEMNFDGADFEKYKLEPGDLLLNEASGSPGEVGKPAIWNGEIDDCCFQNTLLRLRPQEVELDYLYWYCYSSASSGQFGEAGRGVNIRHLGKQGLAQFPIPVPPRREQPLIAAQIRATLERAASLRQEVQDGIARVGVLRRSVLAEAFAGRLVPQDPNDKPAPVLLERIATSRHAKPMPQNVSA